MGVGDRRERACAQSLAGMTERMMKMNTTTWRYNNLAAGAQAESLARTADSDLVEVK
jgi:hypothetical protein